MEFNNDDLYLLKKLSFNKTISITAMIGSAALFTFGIYRIIFQGARGLNIALTIAAVVVFMSCYLIFYYIKFIEKYIKTLENSGEGKNIRVRS